jgi:hypothetical protein
MLLEALRQLLFLVLLRLAQALLLVHQALL